MMHVFQISPHPNPLLQEREEGLRSLPFLKEMEEGLRSFSHVPTLKLRMLKKERKEEASLFSGEKNKYNVDYFSFLHCEKKCDVGRGKR